MGDVEHRPIAVHRRDQLVLSGALDRVAGDGGQDGSGPLHVAGILGTGRDGLAPDDLFQLGWSAVGDHAAVVDDGDLVSQCVGFFQVLRRQKDAGAIGGEFTDDPP